MSAQRGEAAAEYALSLAALAGLLAAAWAFGRAWLPAMRAGAETAALAAGARF